VTSSNIENKHKSNKWLQSYTTDNCRLWASETWRHVVWYTGITLRKNRLLPSSAWNTKKHRKRTVQTRC